MLDLARLARVVRSSLVAYRSGYEHVSDGVVAWHGERPGADWHVHGWTTARRQMRFGGASRTFVVWKRRWRRADRSETCHSRPDDDAGTVYDALFMAVELFCWLDAALGLHRYASPFHDGGPARRTVARWLHRALPHALGTQSALRRVLIEKSEPRPFEQMFPGGLSPPGALSRRRWRDSASVTSLWRGLAFLFVGATELDVSAAPLLAEARGRLTHPRTVLF